MPVSRLQRSLWTLLWGRRAPRAASAPHAPVICQAPALAPRSCGRNGERLCAAIAWTASMALQRPMSMLAAAMSTSLEQMVPGAGAEQDSSTTTVAFDCLQQYAEDVADCSIRSRGRHT